MTEHKVLDHGFVRLIDKMGNDAAIVQAARVSYGEGTKTVREDRGLIRYLMRHSHTSPFEMCEIKLHIKCPIFVARQWLRHRTANVNEYSGRYSEMKPEFYTPKVWHQQSSINKQAGEEPFNAENCEDLEEAASAVMDKTQNLYQTFLYGGVSREEARIVLPLSQYTEFYWKIDLHNLFHFLKLRGDRHAQRAIRAYADTIEQLVKEWIPLAYEAWVDYQRDAVTFSKQEIAWIRDRLAAEGFGPETCYADAYGMSVSEVREFQEKLDAA